LREPAPVAEARAFFALAERSRPRLLCDHAARPLPLQQHANLCASLLLSQKRAFFALAERSRPFRRESTRLLCDHAARPLPLQTDARQPAPY
jgi:hypothetical protein